MIIRNKLLATFLGGAVALSSIYSGTVAAEGGGSEVDLRTRCNGSEDKTPDCTTSDPIGVVAGDFRGRYQFTSNKSGQRMSDTTRASVKLPNVPENRDGVVTVRLFAAGADIAVDAPYASCLLDFVSGKPGKPEAEYSLDVRREVRLDKPDRNKVRNKKGECSVLPALTGPVVKAGDVAVFSGLASDGTTPLFNNIVTPAF